MSPGRTLALGLLAPFLFSACAGIPDAPLEHVDLGSYTVVEFRLPVGDHSASPYGQRLMGSTFNFGPYRVEFPPAYGQDPCLHDGYRLSSRSLAFVPPFDLGAAGTYTLGESDNVPGREMTEIWSSCVSGAYLTEDRGRMYLPARGVLLILDRQ